MEITFLPTNTSKIHLHVDNSYRPHTERLLKPQTSQKAKTPHIPGRVAERALVLQPGVRPEPLRWES